MSSGIQIAIRRLQETESAVTYEYTPYGAQPGVFSVEKRSGALTLLVPAGNEDAGNTLYVRSAALARRLLERDGEAPERTFWAG